MKNTAPRRQVRFETLTEAIQRENAKDVLMQLLRHGSWHMSAIELDTNTSDIDGEKLRRQALKACYLPEDWEPPQ
jgi:homospermidine synthase